MFSKLSPRYLLGFLNFPKGLKVSKLSLKTFKAFSMKFLTRTCSLKSRWVRFCLLLQVMYLYRINKSSKRLKI
jgi:hypothetical protein